MIIKRMSDLTKYSWRNFFDELERMRREMDHLYGQVAGRGHWSSGAGVFPLINVTEDKDHFYIRAEIPGMQSQDINITANDSSLSISGDRKITAQGDNVNYHRSERDGGKFNRAITLPSDIRIDKIEAAYIDGILRIRVPKAEAAKPKQIRIN